MSDFNDDTDDAAFEQELDEIMRELAFEDGGPDEEKDEDEDEAE